MSRMHMEHQALVQQLNQIQQEKEYVSSDRQALNREVEQLRSHVYQMAGENEALKHTVDKVVTNANPEMFGAHQGMDELVANWMEMDLRDGDELLAALARVYPPSEQQVQSMLGLSAQLRQYESSLQEHCAYFSARFLLYNSIWAQVCSVHFAMDESFQRIREGIAVSLQGVEPILGKRSEPMEQLRGRVRSLFKLEYGEFMDEQKRITAEVANIKLEHAHKLLGEKEAEKQALLHKAETELKALKAKHLLELQAKDQTLQRLRTEHARKQEAFCTAIRQEVGAVREEARVSLSSLAAYQKEVADTIKQLCEQITKQGEQSTQHHFSQVKGLADLHQAQKVKYRTQMRRSIAQLRTQTEQVSTDFRSFLAICSTQLLHICSETTASHLREKRRIRLLAKREVKATKAEVVQLCTEIQNWQLQLQSTILSRLVSDHEEVLLSERARGRERSLMQAEDSKGLLSRAEWLEDLRLKRQAESLQGLLESHLKTRSSLETAQMQTILTELARLPFPLPTLAVSSLTQPPLVEGRGEDMCRASLMALQAGLEATHSAQENFFQLIHGQMGTLVARWLDTEAEGQEKGRELQALQITHQSASTALAQETTDLRTAVELKDQSIAELTQEIELFREEQLRTSRLRVHRRLFQDFKARLGVLKRGFLVRWRLRVQPGFIPPPTPPPPPVDFSDSEDDSELDQIEEFIRAEKQQAMENNALVEAYSKAGKQEKPLASAQVLKFFEEMMDRKYDADLSDMKNQRALRTLPDFFLEHLSRTFGLKKLAIKMLCQVMPSLETMHTEGQPASILACRLVQLYHPDPVPFALAVFLTRVRVEFTPYTEKYQKDKEVRDSRRGLKTAKGKDKGTNAGGGEAYLLDVMGYVYSLFENDRRSGEQLLRLLQPESVELTDYVLFRLCHKMAKLGLNTDGIFGMLDRDGTGSVSEVEFVRGARRGLELWIAAEDLSRTYQWLAAGAAQLSKEAFQSKIVFKTYLDNTHSDLYIASRCRFLLSLVEVYHTRQKYDGAFAKNLMGGQKALTYEGFQELLRKLEPGLEEAKLAALHREALSLSSDSDQISLAAFVRVMLRHPMGQLKSSPFCTSYSDMKEIEAGQSLPAAEEVKSANSTPSPQPGRKATTRPSSPETPAKKGGSRPASPVKGLRKGK